MAKRICIQSGHWNMTSGATGAPGEQIRTVAIGLQLVDKLRKAGFIVYHTDAFAEDNEEVTDPDWDLFLSLHCDANYAGDEGGGFIDYPAQYNPDGSVQDGNNAESKRIKEAIESVYFSETGIRNVPGRSNPNTKYYYMWNKLSLKTACNIIEMGESIDPHDNVLLNDTNRISNALLHGIQKAFGVQPTPTPTPPPVVTPPPIDLKPQLEALQKQFEAYKKEYLYKQSDLDTKVSKAKEEGVIAGKLEMKNKIINYINAI